ncbi:MAG: hypothetical protein AAGA22_01135 [Pseudomonadota bacterium]
MHPNARKEKVLDQIAEDPRAAIDYVRQILNHRSDTGKSLTPAECHMLGRIIQYAGRDEQELKITVERLLKHFDHEFYPQNRGHQDGDD